MDDKLCADVVTYGWSMVNTNDHKAPFQYTVGLVETWRHPELIMLGLEADNAHALFCALVFDIRGGRFFQPRLDSIATVAAHAALP